MKTKPSAEIKRKQARFGKAYTAETAEAFDDVRAWENLFNQWQDFRDDKNARLLPHWKSKADYKRELRERMNDLTGLLYEAMRSGDGSYFKRLSVAIEAWHEHHTKGFDDHRIEAFVSRFMFDAYGNQDRTHSRRELIEIVSRALNRDGNIDAKHFGECCKNLGVKFRRPGRPSKDDSKLSAKDITAQKAVAAMGIRLSKDGKVLFSKAKWARDNRGAFIPKTP